MNIHSYSSRNVSGPCDISFRSIALAAVIGICAVAAVGAAQAQETTGTIFGRAAPGDTVVAQSTSTDLERPGDVNARGRYLIEQVPDGMYTVTLENGGQPVIEHLNVGVTVGEGTEVDLDCTRHVCNKVASGP